jgi:nucleoside-diphosphate-sugar epimerase
MTISILGAGWLGMPFGKKLVEQGYTVKGSTTRPDKIAQIKQCGMQPFLLKATPEVSGINVDDFFDCELLFINIPPGRRNPNVQQDYPAQIQQILRKAKASGTQQCIFISSTSVYADENRIMTEMDTPKPDHNSGHALVEAEVMVRKAFGASATILRMAGLAGPGRQMGRFLAGRQNLPNGKAPVNLVHLDDCMGILLAIIEQGKFGETYNVCADIHPRKEDIYPTQARKLGLEPPTFSPDGEVSYKIISNEKVKRELGYTFVHPDPMLF